MQPKLNDPVAPKTRESSLLIFCGYKKEEGYATYTVNHFFLTYIGTIVTRPTGINIDRPLAAFIIKLLPVPMIVLVTIIVVVRWFYWSHFKAGNIIAVQPDTFE